MSNLNTDGVNLANQAQEVASKLKPGTWDAVQALALVSIAKSLASLADSRSGQPPTVR